MSPLPQVFLKITQYEAYMMDGGWSMDMEERGDDKLCVVSMSHPDQAECSDRSGSPN